MRAIALALAAVLPASGLPAWADEIGDLIEGEFVLSADVIDPIYELNAGSE